MVAVAYAGDRVIYVARDGIFRWNPADAAAAPESILPLTAVQTDLAVDCRGGLQRCSTD